jgi:hypothetical protein
MCLDRGQGWAEAALVGADVPFGMSYPGLPQPPHHKADAGRMTGFRPKVGGHFSIGAELPSSFWSRGHQANASHC